MEESRHPIETMSDEAFGWYLAGLTDGEGTFALNLALRGRGYKSMSARFGIKLREDDGANLIKIGERVRCGVINWVKGHNNSKPQVGWNVTRTDDLATLIVPLFDRFGLRMKKARDFQIWRRGVELLRRIKSRKRVKLAHSRYGTGPKATSEERLEFETIWAELRAVRRHVPPDTLRSDILPVRHNFRIEQLRLWPA